MKLSEWADREKLNDAELADLLGVSQPTATRLRNGKRRPGWEVLQRILAATTSQVREEDFFTVPDSPQGEDVPSTPAAPSAAEPAEPVKETAV